MIDRGSETLRGLQFRDKWASGGPRMAPPPDVAARAHLWGIGLDSGDLQNVVRLSLRCCWAFKSRRGGWDGIARDNCTVTPSR